MHLKASAGTKISTCLEGNWGTDLYDRKFVNFVQIVVGADHLYTSVTIEAE